MPIKLCEQKLAGEVVDTFCCWLSRTQIHRWRRSQSATIHKKAPGGAQGVAVLNGHPPGNLPELLKDFTENPIPGGGLVKAEAAGGIVVDLAWCEAAKAGKAAVIDVLGCQPDFQGQLDIGQVLMGFPPVHKMADEPPVKRVGSDGAALRQRVEFAHPEGRGNG